MSEVKKLKANIFQRCRPPRVVHLMGHKIKVRVVEHLEADGQDLYGAWTYDNKTIWLAKGCDWRSVLVHELIHATASLSGWNEGLSQAKEESICVAVEHALAPLIR